MKYTLLCMLLILSACSQTPEQESTLKETTRIVDEYADTLTGAIGDTRALKEQMDTRNAETQKQIEESTK